jgi:hypothetical protein
MYGIYIYLKANALRRHSRRKIHISPVYDSRLERIYPNDPGCLRAPVLFSSVSDRRQAKQNFRKADSFRNLSAGIGQHRAFT